MPRRRLRLPTLPKQGEWEPFSAEQVGQLEQAYGRELPEVVLLKMQLATALYTAAAPIEHAISMDDFIRGLTIVQDAAKNVMNVLPIGLGLNPKKPVASKKVGFHQEIEIIEQYFALTKIQLALDWTSIFDLLAHSLTATEAVCAFAAKELVDYGYTHNWLWNNWIGCLTIIMKEHNLPYKVRADSDKLKGQGSPFVRLVEALQSCIPVEARHSTREFALAKAIIRARRGRDIDCKFTDVIDLELFPGADKELRRLNKQA
jgi:hypothetical protein